MTLEPASSEGRIRTLVAETEKYLAALSGPGLPEVRAGLAAAKNNPVRLPVARPNKVVADHLATATVALAPAQPALAAALAAAAPLLDWVTYDAYPPTDIGEVFPAGHAFTSIIGDTAAIAAHDYYLGFFLIAPHVLYRDHHHPAPELYVPLTGPHGWRFAPNAPLTLKPAHEPVWNEPGRPHLIKAGSLPFLCVFVWTRDVSEPAHVLRADDWAELEALVIRA